MFDHREAQIYAFSREVQIPKMKQVGKGSFRLVAICCENSIDGCIAKIGKVANCFFKNGPTTASFWFIFGLFKQTTQFHNKYM